MASFPYMPFYWGDHFRDTHHLNALEQGVYLLLIGSYWSLGGPLPDDDRKLAKLTKLSADDWTEMRREIEPFFEVGGGLWRHSRIEHELAKAAARFQQSHEAAERSVQVRAQRKAEQANAQADGETDGRADVELTKSKSKSKSIDPDAYASGRARGRPPAPVSLPDWIPRAEWDGYLEMRKRIRKAPTERAVELLIGKLEKMKAKGIDLVEVLNKSTVNSWTDVYEPKAERDSGGKPKTGVNRRSFDEPGYYDDSQTGKL